MKFSILLYLLLAKTVVVGQRTLDVTTHQTTALVFPHPVVTADRGSHVILIQKAKGAEHVLLLKAAKTNFVNTNLTVVTKDGNVFSFVVSYHPQPDTLLFDLRAPAFKSRHPVPTPLQIQENLERIYNTTDKHLRKVTRKYELTFALEDIYTQDAYLYFAFRLKNESTLDYYCNAFTLLIKDKKQRRRTARQAIALPIIDSYDRPDMVKGKTDQRFLVAVPLFTIPDKKKLVVQLMEKNGGRHISLTLRNASLLRARLLPSTP